MRADRLVAILLLLQRRGQVTAAEIAEELEISERTARRDLDALGMAGIPIYAVRGRGGGWRLAGGGRTDLSGLTSDEAQALFLLAGPHADVTKEVKAALRKLMRALPEPLRAKAEAASTSTIIDPGSWDRSGPAERVPSFLDAVQTAVIDATQVRLGYRDRTGAITERVVHPLGVAAKGPVWYLLGDTDAGRRTFRIDRIQSMELTGEPVVRPDGYDLAEAWREIVADVEQIRAPVVVHATIDREFLGFLQGMLGRRVAVGTGTDDGHIEVEIRGHTVRSLAGELAGFGAALDVRSPPELQEVLGELGRELAARYASPPST